MLLRDCSPGWFETGCKRNPKPLLSWDETLTRHQGLSSSSRTSASLTGAFKGGKGGGGRGVRVYIIEGLKELRF